MNIKSIQNKLVTTIVSLGVISADPMYSKAINSANQPQITFQQKYNEFSSYF